MNPCNARLIALLLIVTSLLCFYEKVKKKDNGVGKSPTPLSFFLYPHYRRMKEEKSILPKAFLPCGHFVLGNIYYIG
jgi:hypothetical protein